MKKLINEQRLPLLGAGVGLLAGYLYYKLVGCSSGTCAITSNPINSSLYGAMMGTLFFSLFKKEKRVSK